MMSIPHKILTRLLGLVVLLALAFSSRAGDDDFPPRPNPPRLVNDLAGMMSPDQQNELEKKLVRFDDSSSTQIAIVTIKSLGDYDAGDYAIKLGNKWGIGKAGKNNGIVIFASLNDHKAFIATGRGLEGALTDLEAGEIVRKEMVPYFKQDNYYEGFSHGVDAVIAATRGEYTADAKKKHKVPVGGTIALIVIVYLILWIISKRRGGGGGSYMSGRGSGGFGAGWFLGSGLGSGWGSGSGGWGGGGSSGGGGGFGGFGGGSFGGGGAGGSW